MVYGKKIKPKRRYFRTKFIPLLTQPRFIYSPKSFEIILSSTRQFFAKKKKLIHVCV